jgi:hypothetical protein
MAKWILRCWPIFAAFGLLFLVLAVVYAKLEWGVAGTMLIVLAARFAFMARAREVAPKVSKDLT